MRFSEWVCPFSIKLFLCIRAHFEKGLGDDFEDDASVGSFLALAFAMKILHI